jgi:hypothetical protein
VNDVIGRRGALSKGLFEVVTNRSLVDRHACERSSSVRMSLDIVDLGRITQHVTALSNLRCATSAASYELLHAVCELSRVARGQLSLGTHVRFDDPIE